MYCVASWPGVTTLQSDAPQPVKGYCPRQCPLQAHNSLATSLKAGAKFRLRLQGLAVQSHSVAVTRKLSSRTVVGRSGKGRIVAKGCPEASQMLPGPHTAALQEFCLASRMLTDTLTSWVFTCGFSLCSAGPLHGVTASALLIFLMKQGLDNLLGPSLDFCSHPASATLSTKVLGLCSAWLQSPCSGLCLCHRQGW